MHEERDALRVRNEQLENKLQALEVSTDDLRAQNFEKSDSYKADARAQTEFDLKKAKSRLADQKDELELLRKQVEGRAEFKDFNVHIANLKKRAGEREAELGQRVDHLLALKQQADRDLAEAQQKEKDLRADLDKTLSKEKLAELVKD